MTLDLQENILDALNRCLPHKRPLALHEPYFCGNEKKYLNECIETTMVSYVGAFVSRFEGMLIDFTGAKFAIATVNGTAALHIALLAAGVQSGDEVLIPTMTFVATANAVTFCNAIPHFVDGQEETLGMDPYKLRNYLNDISVMRDRVCFNKLTGRPVRAMVPVHTFGHPVDMDPLMEICTEFNITMVEDAAESLGSYYKKRHTGTFGKLGILSFNGNKIVTTGGGGAILTNDEELAKMIRHITTTAKVPHRWEYYHDQVGYNYRMPNINAAVGCAQMESLPVFLDRKKKLAESYKNAFEKIEGVRFFLEPENAQSNYWLNILLLDNKKANYKQELLERSNLTGIMTRPAWELMHTLPMFKAYPKMDLSIAENIASRLINIPSSAFLG